MPIPVKEQETIITWLGEDQEAEVFTMMPSVQRAIQREGIKPFREEAAGKWYKVPLKFFWLAGGPNPSRRGHVAAPRRPGRRSKAGR